MLNSLKNIRENFDNIRSGNYRENEDNKRERDEDRRERREDRNEDKIRHDNLYNKTKNEIKEQKNNFTETKNELKQDLHTIGSETKNIIKKGAHEIKSDVTDADKDIMSFFEKIKRMFKKTGPIVWLLSITAILIIVYMIYYLFKILFGSNSSEELLPVQSSSPPVQSSSPPIYSSSPPKQQSQLDLSQNKSSYSLWPLKSSEVSQNSSQEFIEKKNDESFFSNFSQKQELPKNPEIKVGGYRKKYTRKYTRKSK